MKGTDKVRRIVLEIIFILTCSLPPPCRRRGSRTSYSVLICFFPLDLSIPYAFLKRTVFYRSFCHSRSAGGLLFIGLKWRSSFAAGSFLLGTNCSDGLSLVHGKTDQGNQVHFLKGRMRLQLCLWVRLMSCPAVTSCVIAGVAPVCRVAHPSWTMCVSGSRLSTCLEQPIWDAAPALGERIQPFVSCIMGLDLTGHELSLFLQKSLVQIHPLCPLAGDFRLIYRREESKLFCRFVR